jgi:hypothetical protein
VDDNLVPDLLLGYGPVNTEADFNPDDPIFNRATSPP